MRRIGVLLVVALLAVVACSDGDGDGDEVTPRRTTTETPRASPDTTEASTPTPTLPLSGTATCTDGAADTAEFTPGADLLGVDLTATDADLTVLFRLVGPVPADGTTLWSVFAQPPGGATMQFGARLEGDTRSPFVYHFGDRIQQDLPPEAMVVGTDSIEVVYPIAVVGFLRPPFDWRAESTIDVEDVDYCPGGAEATVLDLRELPFTG